MKSTDENIIDNLKNVNRQLFGIACKTEAGVDMVFDQISLLAQENAELRDALRNCAYAASGQNWQQISWIVEGALAERTPSNK